jgi:hypothetical protein
MGACGPGFSSEFWAALLGALVGGLFTLLGALAPEWMRRRQKLRGIRMALALEMRLNLLKILGQHVHAAGFWETVQKRIPDCITEDGDVRYPTVEGLGVLRVIQFEDSDRRAIGLEVDILPRGEFDAVAQHYSAVRTIPAYLPDPRAPGYRSHQLYALHREIKIAVRTLKACAAMLRAVDRADDANMLETTFDQVVLERDRDALLGG